MKLVVGILVIFAIISQMKCNSAEEESEACMIKLLKEKGLLNSDFPNSNHIARCFLMSSIISSLESGFYLKFDDKEGIDADCVKNELKVKKFIYYVIKMEIIEKSKNMPEEDIKKTLNENKQEMKNILNEAATTCNSDPKRGGIFDDVLDIKNTSQAGLEAIIVF